VKAQLGILVGAFTLATKLPKFGPSQLDWLVKLEWLLELQGWLAQLNLRPKVITVR